MSQEASPVMRAEFEIKKENPELQGEELSNTINKRIEERKKQSIEEKKQGHLRYRGNLFWAGITSPEQFDEKCREVIEDYYSGNFFLERIGRYREIDVSLSLLLLHQRNQWIKEYEAKTVPELMLIDAASISYFHLIRLNEAVNNIMSSIEWSFFALDVPKFRERYGELNFHGKKEDRAIAEELTYRLQEILQPLLDQYNRMLNRNIKALRDLKRGNILLNIGNVGQVNIGDKQINVEKGAGSNTSNAL